MPSVKISDEILDEFKEYTKISHDTKMNIYCVLNMSYENLDLILIVI